MFREPTFRDPTGVVVPPPPITGACDGTPIDHAHLARMTLGDRALEQEVLALFDRQIELLVTRMRSAPATVVATLAHTLKGSACGIGAIGIVAAAEAIESAARSGHDLATGIARLEREGAVVQGYVRLLRQNEAGHGAAL